MHASAYKQPVPFIPKQLFPEKDTIRCDWRMLRAQLLLQWQRLTASDLDSAGPYREKIASLIERKYGIAPQLVENYLRNFERTMPVSTH